MKLQIADSNWNILEEQPDNTPGVFHALSLWYIIKDYSHIENEQGEFVEWGELATIGVITYFKYFKHKNNDKTYGEYIVLKIDENTSLNIQLFYKEFYNFAGPCIEKFICNGKEYINLEYVPDQCSGRALIQKTNDIVIE